MPSTPPSRRGGFVALLALVLAACTDAPTGPSAGRAKWEGNDPVLFVHGWNSGASTWNGMVARFQADGWTSRELHAFSYNTAQSNVTTARVIKTKVDSILRATGAPRVDVVTHSMGGLSARYYVKNLGGDRKVDALVSIAGPNHGTTTAWGCFSTACVEMRPGSSFLSALNATDETPGPVDYGTWWSSCDEVINPRSSTALADAQNTEAACLTHSALKDDALVYAQVRDFVRAPLFATSGL
jgi:triacylglycerol lipase